MNTSIVNCSKYYVFLCKLNYFFYAVGSGIRILRDREKKVSRIREVMQGLDPRSVTLIESA
jgi:hypothetical protein